MNKKTPQCPAVHPLHGTRCWKKLHGEWDHKIAILLHGALHEIHWNAPVKQG